MVSTIRVLIAVAAVSTISFAALGSGFPDPPPSNIKLAPAKRISGSSAIDLKNGLVGNNGTFGLPNSEFEAWATADATVPGMSSRSYPYAQREQLTRALKGQLIWGEEALANYQSVTEAVSKPEGKAHAQAAVSTMEPLLGRLRDATKNVSKAGEGDWDSAQSDARKALLDFRAAYTGMHGNVVRH